MIKCILFSLILFASSTMAVCEEKRVLFLYGGLEFFVPSGVTTLGSSGGKDNFTFFQYGAEKGKNYLAFTDMSNASIEYGCSTKDFYGHLAGVAGPSTCSVQEIASFKDMLVKDSDVGEWSGSKLTSYYFLNKSQASLFVFYNESVIKVDSDYLTKAGLKGVLEKYL